MQQQFENRWSQRICGSPTIEARQIEGIASLAVAAMHVGPLESVCQSKTSFPLRDSYRERGGAGRVFVPAMLPEGRGSYAEAIVACECGAGGNHRRKPFGGAQADP